MFLTYLCDTLHKRQGNTYKYKTGSKSLITQRLIPREVMSVTYICRVKWSHVPKWMSYHKAIGRLLRSSIIKSSFIAIWHIWIFVGDIATFCFGYNIRIRNFWYLVFTFSAFLFVYCFIWMECSQLKSINCCYCGSWRITCTKLTHIFVINFYRSFISKSNSWKNIWRRNLK